MNIKHITLSYDTNLTELGGRNGQYLIMLANSKT